jgi:hypothetical protein
MHTAPWTFPHDPLGLRVLVLLMLCAANPCLASALSGEDVSTVRPSETAVDRAYQRPRWTPDRPAARTWLSGESPEKPVVARSLPAASSTELAAGGAHARPTAGRPDAPVSNRGLDTLRPVAYGDDLPYELSEVGSGLEPESSSCYPDRRICQGLGDFLNNAGSGHNTRYGCPKSPGGTLFCNRFWVRSSYLLSWTKGTFVPALVTSSPIGTTPESSGVLGEPSTAILFGGNAITGDAQSGVQFTLVRRTPQESTGVEIDYRFFGTGATRFAADSSTMPILARPYYDTAISAQDALLAARPDFLGGSVTADLANDFEIADLLLRKALFGEYCEHLEFVVGYRFAQLDESLTIHQFSQWTRAQGVILAGTTKSITDSFDTANQFHGGQFGVAYETPEHCASNTSGTRIPVSCRLLISPDHLRSVSRLKGRQCSVVARYHVAARTRLFVSLTGRKQFKGSFLHVADSSC